jgi:hypothetical protein
LFLESTAVVEKESHEQDENSLPKSKRMKRDEEGKVELFFICNFYKCNSSRRRRK